MKSTHLVLALALGLTITGALAVQDQPTDPPHRGRPGAMVRARILKKFDTDQDGKLNDAERAAAKEWFKANHPILFAKADTNGDGTLSPEERRAMRELIRQHVLEKFDADHDGRLNEQERQAAREAFQQRVGK